jgi:integrase
VTLRKEMATFRACWKWGVHGGKLRGPFPSRGLKYPKGEEKPPFQTWEEVERRIALGGLTGREQEELWDRLFLTRPEVGELLAFVRANAAHPWTYPAFCLAAHTGARRSEILRVKTFDVDFASEQENRPPPPRLPDPRRGRTHEPPDGEAPDWAAVPRPAVRPAAGRLTTGPARR